SVADHPRVREADAGVGAVPVARHRRRHVDYAAHCAAVLDGKSATQVIETADRIGVDDADRVLKVLDVKRLRELEAVDHDQRLARQPTAHSERSRDIRRGGTGKLAERTKDIVAEMRGAIELLPADNVAAFRTVAEERVVARGDYDHT